MKTKLKNLINNNNVMFLFFLILFTFSIASIIFLKENQAESVSFVEVFLWQLSIWLPWIIIKSIILLVKEKKQRLTFVYVLTGFLIGIHFWWFYFISSNFSPYLNLPATRYGVYPYFFIFWTIIDIVFAWWLIFYLSEKNDKPQSNILTKFELTKGDKVFYCLPEEINWLSAENYYTQVYTAKGRLLMRKPLKYFYENLPHDQFKKIHRSTIVNVNFVSGLTKSKNNKLEVTLKDDSVRPVSRNYIKEIKEAFKNISK